MTTTIEAEGPDDLDITGKKVLVIGSGATAATLGVASAALAHGDDWDHGQYGEEY